jgi:leucyl/phenylalanyl-tRNA--protein transferase
LTPPGPPYWLPPAFADESGLVGVGGDLEADTLLAAYRAGVFPWFGEDDPILWFSPDPRGVIPLDAVHVPSRLARTIRSGRFTVTVNRRFREVMAACGENRDDGTWVTAEMLDAYEHLHRLGYAHSLEVWRGDRLAGGVYGVALGGLFAAESMFHRITDASKVALVSLTDRLRTRGFTLMDIQMVTDHTATFGAVAIPRSEYLRRVTEAVERHPVTFGNS